MHPTTKPSAHTEKQVRILRDHALAYPDAHEDFPWGHSAFKVRSKAFAFLHADAEGFSISVKLPDSSTLALEFPFVEPTGYGLGKSGWVTARFGPKDSAPLSILKSWLEESYSAIAPKKLLHLLLARSAAPSSEDAPTVARRAPAKKALTKKDTKALAKKEPAKKRTSAKKASAKKASAKKASAKKKK